MIHKDMLIEDLVREHPTLVGPLKVEGIVCIACGEPVWGTLDQQAKDRNIENLDAIISRMNERIAGQD